MASRNRDIGRKYDSGSAKRKRNEKRKVLEGQLRNTLTKFLKAETSKNGSDIEIPNKTVTCGPLRLHSASLESPEAHNHSTPADPSTLTPQHLLNGEQQKRRWFIYSESNDSAHCFACRLFSDISNCALSSRKGTNDWQHLSVILKCHENNKTHRECMLKWFELEKRLKTLETIDRETEAQIRSEAQRWKDVMERLLAIVQFLASHNLAFRGHRETITSDSSDRSGNFLDLLKLIAKFDPLLREHLNQIVNKKIGRNHYLSKETQNEFILLMANHVVKKITEKVFKNKYYSIILDCTRDIARIEQLSVILRTTNMETASIEEHFIRFVAVKKTTAEELTNYLLKELDKLGLNIANCRGQSYYNGSNMRGIQNGVQQKILNLNPLAFFVPCGSHSWNLVLSDAASSSVQAQTFFGTLQRLYTIFS
ncbi:uncharacterized protein LOC126908274 [Daktulosphaira vitifoliae]|uniref:uncharacterized protein LOC126908274 n=1 Tax=Daktulosphaira vitifoliae TaxID=58002 RepID=UPI0021AA7FF4|nr:uncharacterized protein LOC126908274 [Daktulosphaira vitifoliae]